MSKSSVHKRYTHSKQWGGATLSCDQINNIIKKAPHFLGIMETAGLDAFSAGKSLSLKRSYSDDDIVPEFMEFLTAFGQALHQLENPSKIRADALENSGSTVSKAFDMLINDTPERASYAKKDATVGSFVYHDGADPAFPGIKTLIPGVNMLGSSLFDAVNGLTAFQRLIVFLYEFIAELDFSTNPSGAEIIGFLRKHDTVNFHRLCAEVVKDITNENHYASRPQWDSEFSEDKILQALQRSLVPVAETIKKELQSREYRAGDDPAPLVKAAGDVKSYKFKTDATPALKQLLAAVGADGDAASISAEWASIGKPKGRAPDSITLHGYLNTGFVNGTLNQVSDVTEPVLSGGSSVAMSDTEYAKLIVNHISKTVNPTAVGISAKETDLAKVLAATALPAAGKALPLPLRPAGTDGSAPLFMYDVALPHDRIDKALIDKAKEINDYVTAVKKMATPIGKVIAMALYDAVISGDEDFATDLTKSAVYAPTIIDAFAKYTDKLKSRVEFVNNKLKSAPAAAAVFKNQIVNGFITGIGSTIDAGNVKQEMSSGVAGNCQQELYEKVISNNVSAFDKIFNLVQNGESKPLDAILKELDALSPIQKRDRAARDAVFAKYRLNVKKLDERQVGGRKRVRRMRGGAGDEIEVINALRYVPALKVDGRRKIYLTPTESVTEAELFASRGEFGLRSLAQEIYTSELDAPITVNVGGRAINIDKDASSRAIINILGDTIFQLTDEDIMTILNRNSRMAPNDAARITKIENDLKANVLAQKSTWKYDGQNWTSNGSFNINDQCTFLTEETGRDCVGFLNECGLEQGTLKGCYEVIKRVNKNKAWPTDLSIKENVTKISPRVAFNILKKFNFDTIVEKDTNSGSRLYNIALVKVEPVGKWLKRFEKADFQSKFASAGPVDQVVKAIKENPYFLNYLSLLVEWVNAHPVVLNPGWTEKAAPAVTDKPNYNFDELKMYEYYPPTRGVQQRGTNLSMLLHSLNQLGGNFKEGTYSYKRAAMFNDMRRHVADDIEMPFNRAMFDHNMRGGNGDEIVKFLEGGNKGSSELLKGLYEQIVDVLKSRRIDLSPKSKQALDGILNRISASEKEANEILLKEIKRAQILKATGQRIDIANVNDADEIKAIEERYLDATKRAERSSAKFIDALVTMLTVTVKGKK